MLTKEQERVLKHLMSCQKDAQNCISISNQTSTHPPKIDDEKLIQILTYLEQKSLVTLKWHSPHRDNLNCFVDVSLLPNGLDYFRNKKVQKKERRWEKLKWLIPTIISIIALLWDLANTLYCSNLKDMLVK